MHVSGDGLRVVEDETKGLIVDQTIEKVSFCAPDRNHERGFSYICRDGTTRRWMCHGFLALRESGERMSHAVGCAFAACLERKQRRDKECGVTMTFDQANNTFTRQGSFRTTTMTEKMERSVDVPKSTPVNPFAIERPHATPHMLERQGSFRGLSQLGNNSPFKRQMSLRVNDLPSNAERLKAFVKGAPNKPVSPIPEISPGDSVTALCQQLSQGLSQLTHSGSDDFNFNSQTSVNQNVFATTTLTETIEFTSSAQPTITNFNSVANTQSTASSFNSVQPNTTLSFNTGLNQSSTPNKSPNPSVDSAVLNNAKIDKSPNASIDSNVSLPNPDQWLGQIVNSASPALGIDRASPRRPPMLGPHSRTMSLGTAEGFGRLPNQPDPFDAEWAAIATRQNNAQNTNPFLNSSNPQPFQVRL